MTESTFKPLLAAVVVAVEPTGALYYSRFDHGPTIRFIELRWTVELVRAPERGSFTFTQFMPPEYLTCVVAGMEVAVRHLPGDDSRVVIDYAASAGTVARLGSYLRTRSSLAVPLYLVHMCGTTPQLWSTGWRGEATIVSLVDHGSTKRDVHLHYSELSVAIAQLYDGMLPDPRSALYGYPPFALPHGPLLTIGVHIELSTGAAWRAEAWYRVPESVVAALRIGARHPVVVDPTFPESRFELQLPSPGTPPTG